MMKSISFCCQSRSSSKQQMLETKPGTESEQKKEKEQFYTPPLHE